MFAIREIPTRFAFNSDDTVELRMQKSATFLLASSCSVAGAIWSFMYYLIFGWSLTTVLPLIFLVIVGGALVLSHRNQNHYYTIYAQILCIIYIPALIQWSIGGAFDSGFVMSWALLGPLCSLMFFSIRQSLGWLALYLLNLAITVLFDGFFTTNGQYVSESMKLIFFIMNLGFASTVVFIFAGYYVQTAINEQQRATRLFEVNLNQEIALRQNEKLATLGKLSAGIAHELNNPAAATIRGADQLKLALTDLEQSEFKFGQSQVTKSQIDLLAPYLEIIEERAARPVELDPLTRSDKQSGLEAWLESHDVAESWSLAPNLVDVGLQIEDLTLLNKNYTQGEFKVVLSVLCNTFNTRNLLEEIRHGSSRISEIVGSLKSYSYLDQAPSQRIDIHDGLRDTLVMLRSKLKSGIQVITEFADQLPQIEAFGSELNQVWTNIIDNAVHAMAGKGELILRTRQQDEYIIVEIEDNGPGIPEGDLNRIFDPFFTTKKPGEGTGLGLHISHGIIVKKHGGELLVSSDTSGTRFIIRLPLVSKQEQDPVETTQPDIKG